MPRWECFFFCFFFVLFFLWTYLLWISERTRQYSGLYKYVGIGGGGGRGAIVSESKHACLIISCNIPIFILPISLTNISIVNKTIPYLLQQQGKTYPVQKLLCKPQRSRRDHGSVFRLSWFFWFLKFIVLSNVKFDRGPSIFTDLLREITRSVPLTISRIFFLSRALSCEANWHYNFLGALLTHHSEMYDPSTTEWGDMHRIAH